MEEKPKAQLHERKIPQIPLVSKSSCPSPQKLKSNNKNPIKSYVPSLTQSIDFTNNVASPAQSISKKTFNKPSLPFQKDYFFCLKNQKLETLQNKKNPLHTSLKSLNLPICKNFNSHVKSDSNEKILFKNLNNSKTEANLHKAMWSVPIILSNHKANSLNSSEKFNEDSYADIIKDSEDYHIENLEICRKSIESRPTLCQTEGAEMFPIIDKISALALEKPSINLKPIRESLHKNLKFYTSCHIIQFFEVLSYLKNIELSPCQQSSIWQISCLEKLFKCFYSRPQIDDNNIEICEKIIIFALTPLCFTDYLHKSLLVSVNLLINQIGNPPNDLEDMFNNIVQSQNEQIWESKKMPLLGLANILFLDSFFPEILNKLIGLCEVCDINILKIVFKLTRINVQLLRKRKLDDMIIRGKKCLELVFFMFAGMVVCFYSIFTSERDKKKVFRMILKKTKNNLPEILDIARNVYLNYNAQN
ncbi:hypothetical protein SteCoe_26486 [Stentor coeruleus]|uniref:Uncharacterized protein n=1 Tax=Stentor coeruleus TaxID=5963 RepID=A0A1R2BD42_9CILI|nr:hypothetical protein SteCoe_26486 [Stentor coeruleus]